MIPIAATVIFQASKSGEDKNFNTDIVLSVACAASIGGVSTPIGTTINLQDYIADAPLVIVIAALYQRTTKRYGEKGM